MVTVLMIDRMANRYLVPEGDPGIVARLDRILARVHDQALDAALTKAGLDTTGHWCIERLERSVTIDLDASDATNAAHWAGALTEAVVNAARAGQVVRFGSDAHVLVDLIVSCSKGDTQRRWAWDQTRITQRSWPNRSDSLLAITLSHHIDLALRTLPGLMRRDHAIVERIDWQTWVAVATAAGLDEPQSANLSAADRQTALPPTTASRAGRAVVGDHGTRRLAERVLSRSATTGEPDQREVLAVSRLALRLADPTLAVPPDGWSALSILDDRLGRRRSAPVDEPAAESLDGRRAVERPLSESGEPRHDEARHDEATTTDLAVDTDRRHPSRSDRPGQDHEGLPLDLSAEESLGALHADDEEATLTSFGGLLFLWHVIDDLAIHERVAAPDHPLSDRPFRWILHTLGGLIIGADDPATLVFAGLGPCDDPVEGDPPSNSELDAMQAIVDDLAAGAARRLDPSVMTLSEIIERNARIVADPGWVELHFSLDDVDLGLRRAGLDLDPGFVAWAGVVMRFVYD